MSKFSLEKRFNKWVVILDEQNIRRFYNVIQGQLEDSQVVINAKLKFENKTSLDTDQIEEVISSENLSGRKIKELFIWAESGEKKITIRFGEVISKKHPDEYSDHVIIQVEGPSLQWVNVAASVIEDRINAIRDTGIRNTYYIITTVSAVLIMGLKFLPVILNKLAAHNITLGLNLEQEVARKNTSVYLTLAIALGVYVTIYNLRPNLVFLFGKEIETHRRRLSLRKNIFWAIIVPTALAIIWAAYQSLG